MKIFLSDNAVKQNLFWWVRVIGNVWTLEWVIVDGCLATVACKNDDIFLKIFQTLPLQAHLPLPFSWHCVFSLSHCQLCFFLNPFLDHVINVQSYPSYFPAQGCEAPWVQLGQRAWGGTPWSARDTCIPQPTQVAFPQFLQATFEHILVFFLLCFVLCCVVCVCLLEYSFGFFCSDKVNVNSD